jgi:aldose 1-epimerase
VLTTGATLRSLHVADGTNVVLPPGDGYAGAVVGRYANRIARGAFELDGVAYQVPVNDPPNALHGGAAGFDTREWTVLRSSGRAVSLGYVSADGEEGFPGRLDVEVTYTLDDDALRLSFRATTDAPTVVNLASHTYWNLAGDGTIDGHELQVDASEYVPVDDTGIPTDGPAPVAGTRFDLRAPRVVAGERFDHTFVLDGGVTLADPASGRRLVVETSEPGVQVYTGDRLHAPRAGIALETQHFPDSPNRPGFPSVVLRPDELFESMTGYRLA